MLQKIQMESCKINWGGNQTERYAGLLFDLWAELKGFFKNTKNVGRRNWYVLLWPATSSSASGGEALQGWERKKERGGGGKEGGKNSFPTSRNCSSYQGEKKMTQLCLLNQTLQQSLWKSVFNEQIGIKEEKFRPPIKYGLTSRVRRGNYCWLNRCWLHYH